MFLLIALPATPFPEDLEQPLPLELIPPRKAQIPSQLKPPRPSLVCLILHGNYCVVTGEPALIGLDCGCYKPPSVSGVVFKDANMDGSQTASVEKGIPNIEVQLSKGTDSTFRL